MESREIINKVVAFFGGVFILCLLPECTSNGVKCGPVGTSLVRADSCLYANDFDRASVFYRKALRWNPRCTDAHIGLGLALRYQDSTLLAGKEFMTAYRLNPSYSRTMYYYGQSLNPDMGMMQSHLPERMLRDSAIYYIEKAVAKDPSLSNAHLDLWTLYLSTGDFDKADEQIMALYKKDFFPQVMMNYAYNLLVGADSGAVVFSNGDMDTYPPEALQIGEGFRTDVRVVNLSLLNAGWYATYVKNVLGVPISLPDETLDTLHYLITNDRKIILLSEVLVFDIIRSAGETPVYFFESASPSVRQRYKGYTSSEGFLVRVGTETTLSETNVDKFLSNLRNKYRMGMPSELPEWSKNPSPLTKDYSMLALKYAIIYLDAAWACAERNQMDEARTYARKAFEIAEPHCERDVIKVIIINWLKIDPEDPKALTLKSKYLSGY